jgi:hypothetical protein
MHGNTDLPGVYLPGILLRFTAPRLARAPQEED